MLDKIRFEIKVLFFSLDFGHKGQSGVFKGLSSQNFLRIFFDEKK